MSATKKPNHVTVDAAKLEDELEQEEKWDAPKGWKFWLVLVSICLVGFLVPLDGTVVFIALPRIANEVQLGEKYIWVSSSFWLAQTVFQPLFAQLSNILGRKRPMIFSVLVFGIGGAIAGSANSATALIAGRTLQGFGSAGMMLLMEVILCDIVPLRQRSQYLSYALSASAAGAIIGPPLGGAIADKNWRWIFYMSVPLSGMIAVIMMFCLRLQHISQQSWKSALLQVDWIGNLIFIGSITSILLGLVLGGIVFNWGSWHIITPLVIGIVGWTFFHVFEARCCTNPAIPKHIFANRTAVAGFAMIYMHSILTTWLSFQWPLYFQAVLGASPLKAGVNYLVFEAFLIPTAGVAGRLLTKFGAYRSIHTFGFGLLALSSGLNILLSRDTSTAVWAVLMALNAIGLGVVLPSILPVVLNSLEESDVAVATGMYSFLRSFGYIWGSTIPSILFNSLSDRFSEEILDPDVRKKLSNGHAYEYASGSYLASVPAATKHEAIGAFAKSLKIGWGALIAFSLCGMIFVVVEKHLPLRTSLKTNYGLEESKAEKVAEP